MFSQLRMREEQALLAQDYALEQAEEKGLERGLERGRAEGIEQGLEHGLRTLSLLVSLYFFSSKNAILTRWFSCPLFVMVKTSPVVSSRILKL